MVELSVYVCLLLTSSLQDTSDESMFAIVIISFAIVYHNANSL